MGPIPTLVPIAPRLVHVPPWGGSLEPESSSLKEDRDQNPVGMGLWHPKWPMLCSATF